MQFVLPYAMIYPVIRSVLAEQDRVFLVGGVVRDLLIKKEPNDIDLVVNAPAATTKGVARRLANQFHGGMYVLDEERNTFRVLLQDQAGKNWKIDIAGLRGDTIKSDLMSRDFSINAIALDITDPVNWEIIDPSGGIEDLKQNYLKTVTNHSLQDDSIRVLRGVRMMLEFHLHSDDSFPRMMEKAVSGLTDVSGERFRDELFRLLDMSNAADGLEMLFNLGVLHQIFPEFGREDPRGWLLVVESLGRQASIIECPIENEKPMHGLGECFLGVEHGIKNYLEGSITSERSRLSLLKLAAIFNCRDNFVKLVKFMGLSQSELNFLENLDSVKELLAKSAEQKEEFSRKVVYRFYKNNGDTGPAICFYAITKAVAENNEGDTGEETSLLLRNCRILLHAYFVEFNKLVDPTLFLNGNELMDLFGLRPGPMIGNLLETLKEAQAVGFVMNRTEAVQFISDHLHNEKG